jgi:hypothetical protein
MVTDTTEFLSIDYGDIIQIGDKRFRVTGHEFERRFGMEDPKFWVKRALDLDTNEKKILKLSFLESFELFLSGVKIRCFRNPEKEAEILKCVREHPNFMQGTALKDEKGNIVRILDIVGGVNFLRYADTFTMTYEAYYHDVLPSILKKLVTAFEAIHFLHINGFKHGDIRNDHLYVERATQNYVWIDFDYDYDAGENPFGLDIFGLGNVLLYAVGKGFHNLHMIKKDRFTYGDLIDRLDPGDFSILHQWRLNNLRKLYPFIPLTVNNILLHFSRGADIYYEFVDEMVEDLKRCIYSVFDQ